jgi:hypothetical protein
MDEQKVGLAAALDQIRGVDIDEAAVRAYAMRPHLTRRWPPSPSLTSWLPTRLAASGRERLHL